jgi:hypothetical protein
MKSITPHRVKTAYFLLIALEHRTRAPHFLTASLRGNAMLWFDSYREVLSEHARGHHLVLSAWIVAAGLFVLVIVFA